MRCFVAIELPPALRAAVVRRQNALRAAAGQADVRWLDPAGFHLTLKFLGRVDDGRLPALRDALAGVAVTASPIALATGAPGAFPSPRRARVVWLGLSGGTDEVARLANGVDAALAALGFASEARPFHAHLTLGRVRSPRGLGPLARALAEPGVEAALEWVASELVLFQSHLKPTGAVYEALVRCPLGART